MDSMPATITVNEANVDTGMTGAEIALAVARETVVDCPEMEELAVSQWGEAKDRLKKLTEERMAITRQIDASKKQVMDLFRPAVDTLQKVIDIYGTKVSDYRDRLEQARLAEERKRQAEQKAREEELRRQAEEAKAAGKEEVAEAIETAVEHLPTAVVAPQAVSKGATSRGTWSADCVDIKALARAVAEGTVPEDCISANKPKLNQMARALKEKFNVPGCKAEEKRGLAKARRA